jgi:hypothetical protein
VSASPAIASSNGRDLGPGDSLLRRTVFAVVGAEILFLVFLTVFLWNHADPMGDGMEMVGVGAAIMFIFLPLTLPALLVAKEGRQLVAAALLAGLAAFAYFALWLELLGDLRISQPPWA